MSISYQGFELFYLVWLIFCMPTRRVEDLVSKIVASGVSRAKAERIVSGLNNAEIVTALKSAKALKARAQREEIQA